MVSAATPDFFSEAYRGTPPWEIGRPQPVIVALEKAGEIRGAVLDAGCGTGENALFLAERGHDVVGIDGAARAVAAARAKAVSRALQVEFRVLDALQIATLDRSFDTVVDSGLFHVFGDEERPRYAAALASVLRPGGSYFVLCFSEREPNWGGPRRVTREEIRSTFADGWQVEAIEPARFVNRRSDDGGARAWLGRIRKTAESEVAL